MRRVLLAASVGLLIGTAAVEAQAQSLRDAMGMAYRDNPTLQAQRAQLRAIDEGVPQALAGWRPTVTLSGEQGWIRQQGNAGLRTSSRDFRSTTLSVTQNVYDFGKTDANVQKAEADVLAARARLVETEQMVLQDVVSAYMNVVRDQAVVDLNRNNLERLRRQLEATRDRFNVGEVTRTDVAQAESRVAAAEADLIESEGDLEVSRAFFEQVVGTAPGTLAPPDVTLTLPGSREQAVDAAVRSNPTVQARQFEKDAAARTIDSETADLLPNVDLNASAGHTRDVQQRDSTRNSVQASVVVSVPIYQAGAATSQIREAKQSYLRADSLIAEARRNAVESATSAWETFNSVVARIQALQASVEAAEIALDGVEQEAAVGSRTVLDVLDAEQELLNARVALVRSQRDLEVARFDLLSAIGGMTAEGLELPVEFYDEGAHYSEVRSLWWGLGSDVTNGDESSPSTR